jgi:ABC-type sugar transport system ATPase subunit
VFHSSTPLLEVQQLIRQQGQNNLVCEVSFSVQKTSKFAIVGATGSGKTTLLKMMAGLVQPSQGVVLLNGKRVEGPEEKLLPGHPQIAYLSQHFELRNHYRIHELLDMNTKVPAAEAEKIFRLCRINHLMHRTQTELSGGERQRVALARVLVGSSTLLLLDEPFSNLDAAHTLLMKRIINDLSAHLDLTVILVSHDARDSLSWADEIAILENGRLIQKGSPEEVYYRPCNEYAAGLFGQYNLLDEKTMNVFGLIRLRQPEGKRLLVRPEQIRLHPAGVPAQVQAVAFAGPYREAQLQIEGESIIAFFPAHQKIERGDVIKVSLGAEEAWFL